MVLLSFLMLLFFGVNSRPELSLRHMALPAQPFHPKLSFAEYQKETATFISQQHWMMQGKEDTVLLKKLTPFVLKPAKNCPAGTTKPFKKGILLTHGLTDSIHNLEPIAQFFQSQCFYVMTILLPGMSSRPGELLNVHWQQWVSTQQYGTDQLLQKVEEPYLLGYSLGATLDLLQASKQPVFKGLFLITPAIEITPAAAVANLTNLVSWYDPRFAWLDIVPDEDPYKYSSFPFNAAYQMHQLIEQLKVSNTALLDQIPVFMLLSKEDSTVNSDSSLRYFLALKHPDNRAILYERTTQPLPARVLQVKSDLPDRKILSLGHLGLIIPPDHDMYGDKGSFASCAHYFPGNMDAYKQCKAFKEDYRGETTEENLAKGVIRRIGFNPFYADLLQQMKLFIKSTEPAQSAVKLPITDPIPTPIKAPINATIAPPLPLAPAP